MQWEGKTILKHAKRLLLVCALAVMFSPFGVLYMRYEYQNIQVKRLGLQSDNPAFADLRIVYAVDFQYDMAGNAPDKIERHTFQKAVDLINAQQADLIVLGGDYQTFASNARAVAPFLEQLWAPLGVVGVFGNHDFYAQEELTALLPNIHFLGNEVLTIPYQGEEIAIVGVEDLWYGSPALDLSAIGGASLRILLTHNPDYYERMTQAQRDSFDLVLAGHIHAGQATFFGIAGVPSVLRAVTQYGERYRYGEKVPYGKRIYISSGLGGAIYGFPLRFGARPEIVVIE